MSIVLLTRYGLTRVSAAPPSGGPDGLETDFSEFTTGGGLPSGFTQYWQTQPAPDIVAKTGYGDKSLRFVGTQNFATRYSAAAWDELDNFDTGEILAIVETDRVRTQYLYGVAARLVGVGGSSGFGGISARISSTSFEVCVVTSTGVSSTTYREQVAFSTSLNTRYWFRFRVEDAGGGDRTLRGKAWPESGDEPGSWMAQVTVPAADLPAVGAAGVALGTYDTNYSECDYLAGTTGSGTVPLPS